MAINVSQAYSQAAELNQYAADLKSLRNRLSNQRNILGNYWQSAEMTYINQAISNIDSMLLQVAGILEGLNNRIRSAAQDIYREEEEARLAAEKAAREAAEKAAKEAAEKAAKEKSQSLDVRKFFQ